MQKQRSRGTATVATRLQEGAMEDMAEQLLHFGIGGLEAIGRQAEKQSP
ncbi:MAG: hypothetical protein KDH19_05005 [Geminicoccaceae bacterium]|nr:hypothetical protein [Geminicoccaceae bacterium]